MTRSLPPMLHTSGFRDCQTSDSRLDKNDDKENMASCCDHEGRVDSLRRSLADLFPKEAIKDSDSTLLTDSYLSKVLSVPKRTWGKAREKLVKALVWREQNDVQNLKPPAIPVQQYIDSGSIYWKGFINSGQPVLFSCPIRGDRFFDPVTDYKVYAYMVETGIEHRMKPGIDEFVMVISGEGCRPVHATLSRINFFIRIAKDVMVAYPDRVHSIYVWPVSRPVQVIYTAVKPMLPRRIKEKITLLADEHQLLTKLEMLGYSDAALPDIRK